MPSATNWSHEYSKSAYLHSTQVHQATGFVGQTEQYLFPFLYVYFISLNFFIYLLFVYRSHPVAIECITLAVGLWDKQMSYSIFTLSPPLLSFFTTPLFTLSSSCLILPTTWGKWTKNKTYGQLWDFRLLQHIIRSEVIVFPHKTCKYENAPSQFVIHKCNTNESRQKDECVRFGKRRYTPILGEW